MSNSLINRQAALLRLKRIDPVFSEEKKWVVVGIVTITRWSNSNVMADGDYYDRTTWHQREGGPNSAISHVVRLSWDPGDIKLGQDAAELMHRVKDAEARKKQEREEWLNQSRPKLARQIVRKIRITDTNLMIQALADNLDETELLRVGKALGIE
jgi:hypothetical protein